MIKNSKLIGTVIKTPVGWKDFKVGELFDVIRPIKSDVSDVMVPFDDAYGVSNWVNCVTSGINNNGCPFRVSRDFLNVDDIVDEGLTVSANGANTGCVFVQSEPFVVVQDAYSLVIKSDFSVNDSISVYVFLATIMNMFNTTFDYQTKATWTRFQQCIISLPVTSTGEPDFAWMEQYIKAVKQDYLVQKELSNEQEVKSYLLESSVTDTTITDEDRDFLKKWETLPRKTFKLGELFSICSPVSKLNAVDASMSKTSDGINYVVRTGLNNGIRYKVLNDLEINDGEVLSIGQDTGTVFYQRDPFITGDKIKILCPLQFRLSESVGIYFVSMLQKQLFYFSWGSSSFNVSILSSLEISLPVVNDKIATDDISKFMQIKSKPLVESATRAVVGGGTFN